mmetsp:Transcript_2881/g.4696  ORF Transcript_2881/g.4696 Transcript_2881/m.4696 type:complete len:372 (-) Transcript_2881:159-1274(-)
MSDVKPADMPPKASMWKWISLLLMLLQNAITPLVFRFATTSEKAEDRFSTIVAVGCQEALKLVLSFLLVVMEQNGNLMRACTLLQQVILEEPMNTVKLAIPAVFFVLQNSALQLASVHLPAALLQVLWQGKTLVIAMLSVMLLSKRLARASWLAISILAFGLVMVQLQRSKEGKQASMANAAEQRQSLGLVFVICGCFCSGFAAVYFEKLVKQGDKQGKKKSMWIQNMQLAMWSIVLTAMTTLAEDLRSNKSLHSASQGLFHGFNFRVWIMVVNNAVGGLLVALVIKHADNILRGFATALATVLSAFASVFLFGFELHLNFFFGTLLVVGSSLLYGGAIKLPGRWWAEEPTLCQKSYAISQLSHKKIAMEV